MWLEHRGRRPTIHPTAYVAPTATVCGEVTIGPESRVLFGAPPVRIGDHVLVGPHAHLTGCTVEDSVFVATGAAVFNGARLGTRSEVRVHGVVHLRSVLEPDAVVPIGWVAVGDPAEILPPNAHDRIWTIQKALDFPRTVFGLERAPAGETIMLELTRRYARALGHHRDDRILDSP